jgi:hypothetical protein
MPAYDDDGFAPAAPVARVLLRHPESGESIADVPMLIDSGADATLLPKSAVESLERGNRRSRSVHPENHCRQAAGRVVRFLREKFDRDHLTCCREQGQLLLEDTKSGKESPDLRGVAADCLGNVGRAGR